GGACEGARMTPGRSATSGDGAAVLGPLRNRLFEELAVGDSATLERTLALEDIQLFAVMSGDVNPYHVDHEFAASNRFQGVIAHGMWGGALISGLLGTSLPGPGTVYRSQSLRFHAPVRVGDRVVVRVEVSALDAATRQVRLACSCVNQDGMTVIDGEAGAGGLQRLVWHVARLGRIRMAVVHPCDAVSLSAALDARDAGLIEPLLVAPRARLAAVAESAGLDLAGIEIEDVPHSHAA